VNLDLLSKNSVIVTRHYRNRYILRLLEYYKSYKFPCKILILDSSTESLEVSSYVDSLNTSQIQYMSFNSDINMYKKLVEGLSRVKTLYSVICSDDDFITIEGIAESVGFLEDHPDYSTAHGDYVLFKKNTNNQTIFMGTAGYDSIDCEKPEERLMKHFSLYKIPTYSAVHKTGFLKNICDLSVKNSDDYRFGEILPSMLALVEGKMKYLNVLYCARQYDPRSEGQTIENYTDYMCAGSYNEKYKRFRDCILGELKSNTNLSKKDIVAIIDRGEAQYMRNICGISLRTAKVKAALTRFLNIFGISRKRLRSIKHIFKISRKRIESINNKLKASDENIMQKSEEMIKIEHIINNYNEKSIT